VASFTLLRRGFVDENGLSGDKFCKLVTISAADILVRAAQWKIRSPIVIEKRGFPLYGVVAVGTAGKLAFGKLLAVNVFVAIFALCRGRPEIHVDQFGPKVRRLVALDASGGAMRAQQRKRGPRVIEAGEFLPRLCRVAGFAPGGDSVGAQLLHGFLELAVVRVSVATGAVQVLPVVNHRR